MSARVAYAIRAGEMVVEMSLQDYVAVTLITIKLAAAWNLANYISVKIMYRRRNNESERISEISIKNNR